MLKKIKYSLIAIAILNLTGCFNHDVSFKKEIIGDSKDLNESEFERVQYAMDYKDLYLIKKLNEDIEKIERFNDLDLRDVQILKNYKKELGSGSDFNDLKELIDKIINNINKIIDGKSIQIDQKNEILQSQYLSSIKNLDKYQESVKENLSKLVKLLKEKSIVENNIREIKDLVKKLSSELSSYLNKKTKEININNSYINDNHFENVMEQSMCEEGHEIKEASINIYYMVKGVCKYFYIPMKKENSELLLKDIDIIEFIKEKTNRIIDELNKLSFIVVGDVNYNEDLKDVKNRIEKEYKRIERSKGVSKYEMDSTIEKLKFKIEESKSIFESSKSSRSESIEKAMNNIDLSENILKFKELRDSFILESESKILSKIRMPIKSDFNTLKLRIDDEKDVEMIIDKHSDSSGVYLYVAVVDVKELNKDEFFINKYDKNEIPIEDVIKENKMVTFQSVDNEKIILDAIRSAGKFLEE